MTKKAPAGALDRDEWQKLKRDPQFKDKTIYRVSERDMRRSYAHDWSFSSPPPAYYFDNYFLAYGYALRLGVPQVPHKGVK